MLVSVAVFLGISAHAGGPAFGWTDPVGDVTNSHADIISGSVNVSDGLVDLRVRFVDTPYPTDATQNVVWCFDTDQNPSTGTACGPYPGADKAIALFGGLGALQTGDFSIGGIPDLDPCEVGSYDASTHTLRLLVPLSGITQSSSFRYVIESAFGGSFGANERVPNNANFNYVGRYLVSETGRAPAFGGYPLPGIAQLQVEPTFIPFLAVEGNGNPASQSLSITATCGGTLSWSAAESSGWLGLSSTSGTTPATVDVSADISGLGPGVHSASVTVSASGQNDLTVTASLLVIPSDPNENGGCPSDTAGRFTTASYAPFPGYPQHQSFQWYEYFGGHTLGPDDTLVLDFAVIPFEDGTTLVAMDQIDGWTQYQLTFGTDGLVNGIVPYTAGAWNSVHAVYDFAAHEYSFTVNGEPSGTLTFDSDSVQALRVHSFDASGQTSAWFDSISITVLTDGVATPLFGATFDPGSSYTAHPGTIEILDPPEDVPDPPTCILTSTTSLIVTPDKNHLAWSSTFAPVTSDIVTRRITGPFDGSFSAFTPVACNYPGSTMDISSHDNPPAGSYDLWLVRTRDGGIPGSWNEGGAQAQPRLVPYCP